MENPRKLSDLLPKAKKPARTQIKKNTQFSYSQGPMYFLGQQIVNRMIESGYPAHIDEFWRSPVQQLIYKRKGTSNAGPYESAHQFFGAVDILHPDLFWKVGDDYWDHLVHCVTVVEKIFDVELTHGWRDWGWDGPHVQLKDWRVMRERTRHLWEQYLEQAPSMLDSEKLALAERLRPDQDYLDEWFKEVLPNVWKQHEKSVAYANRRSRKAGTPDE